MRRTATPPLEPTLTHERLEALRRVAQEHDVAVTVVGPGSDLRYFTGVTGHSFERLTALVVPTDPDRPARLVVPALELAGMASADLPGRGIETRDWVDGQNPYAAAVEGLDVAGTWAIGDMLPTLHSLQLQGAGVSRMSLAGKLVRELRMRKSSAELDQLRTAGAAIDRVHARVPDLLRPGRTEQQVGDEIAAAIVEEGHASADFVIVGSGPNGASPHHALSDRVLERGDVVVVDIGGPLPSGYNSDSTRTYSLGPVAGSVRSRYERLQQAQQAQVEAVRPGRTFHEVDAVGRELLGELARHFLHRTGHGIGLDVHEEPYVVAGNDLVLEPGMVVTIEPGLYFAGEWGTRIEDVVAVTAEGHERFNARPHELLEL